MTDLNVLIREYCEVLEQERALDERKTALREQIMNAMTGRGLSDFRTPHGSARRSVRFKLVPRHDPVLGLLTADDLFAFAHFTPARVKSELVPKYGRERLLPLFDIQRTEFLLVRRPQESF
jgi:hypothetical protein